MLNIYTILWYYKSIWFFSIAIAMWKKSKKTHSCHPCTISILESRFTKNGANIFETLLWESISFVNSKHLKQHALLVSLAQKNYSPQLQSGRQPPRRHQCSPSLYSSQASRPTHPAPFTIELNNWQQKEDLEIISPYFINLHTLQTRQNELNGG